MSKQLKFDYDGKAYTLEYTRRTVQDMERSGFIAEDVSRKPATMLPTLFAGAFLAHHRREKPEKINEIYNHMPNRDGLIGKLVEMYNDPISALLDEPEDVSGNVQWEVNW